MKKKKDNEDKISSNENKNKKRKENNIKPFPGKLGIPDNLVNKVKTQPPKNFRFSFKWFEIERLKAEN